MTTDKKTTRTPPYESLFITRAASAVQRDHRPKPTPMASLRTRIPAGVQRMPRPFPGAELPLGGAPECSQHRVNLGSVPCCFPVLKMRRDGDVNPTVFSYWAFFHLEIISLSLQFFLWASPFPPYFSHWHLVSFSLLVEGFVCVFFFPIRLRAV